MTGLAFVFLVVMLAMALTREPAGEAPITPNLLDQQSRGTAPAPTLAPAEQEPTDPLSELGVAPGNAGSNDSSPASPPAAAPAPRR